MKRLHLVLFLVCLSQPEAKDATAEVIDFGTGTEDYFGYAWGTAAPFEAPFHAQPRGDANKGPGHPDPDIAFAEGQFYLATQQHIDYVSPGPWVETVEARVGVDKDNDGRIDQWTDWTEIKDSYDYIEGFSKQVARTPAQLDLAKLPAGFGFQVELRLTDTTENTSRPIIERMTLSFAD